MLDKDVAQVRSFNRTVTQTIGALHDHYLGRDRPLAESRLLFEIGVDGAEVGDLRVRLDLDSGYLSRMLRSLENQGLSRTEAAYRDKRARYARLTPEGMAELMALNRRSDRLARSILAHLNEEQRKRLVDGMAEVERLLSASTVRIDEENPASHDAQYCLGRYFDELAERFESGFDPAKSLAPSLVGFTPPRGTFLVARLYGQPIGCGGFKPVEDYAYLKRMWIAPAARGLGVGRRLLQELENRAHSLGYPKIRLETEKALTEAQQLYRSSGYREVPRFNDELYAHHWFEKILGDAGSDTDGQSIRSRRR
jgi:DNA-binding MarR family transcriptional regulator/ribosomal protein S18 acetylase RimI-like enzyme